MASNSVFISYRRNVSGYPARAVFQNLRSNGIDAFLDIESIDSGQFETIILNQIAARPYFVVILGPGCLERCAESGDWLRREIEHALDLNRIIIPLLTSEFKFSASYAAPFLTGKLATLQSFNAVNVHLEFFNEAMDRLRTRFLKLTDLNITTAPKNEQAAVQKKIQQATAEPQVTEKQLNAQEYFEHALARSSQDFDGQIADYNEAIRLSPQFAGPYNNRGTARKAKGDIEGAINDYNQAIRFNPRLPEAYYNRGIAHGDKGEWGGAIIDYDEAIRLNPRFAAAYNNRGIVRDIKGDFNGAIADCSAAIRLNPRFVEAYYSRGDVWKHKGNWDRAIADYSQAINLNSLFIDAYFQRGNALNNKRDLSGAIADYSQVILLNSQDAEAYKMRGAIYADRGNIRQAVADFRRALELKPNILYAQDIRDYIREHGGK